MIESFYKGMMKLKWIVVLVWIMLAVASVTMLPSLQEVANRTETTFLPKDSGPVLAEQWINQINPDAESKSSAVLVLSHDQGITEQDRAWFYAQLNTLQSNRESYELTEVISVKDIPSLKTQFVSEDNELEMVQIKFKYDVISEKTQQSITDIRALFEEGAPEGTQAFLTGAAGITIDFKTSSDEGLLKTELITVVLVLVILLVVFRSPITPLLSLVVVAISFVMTTGIVGWAADTFGLPISSFTQSFLIAIMFGAGTDYCILLIQRFREELANGLSKEDAILKTMRTVGKTVLYAGSTVLIAFSIIGFATLNMYASAVGVAIGIAITLLAAITLVPALFMIIGSKLFWPLKIKEGAGHNASKLWGRFAKIALKRPILVILVLLIVLLPITNFFEGKRSFDDLSEIDSKYDSVQGFRLIEEKFSPGEVLPISVGIYSNAVSLRDPEAMAAITNITTELSKLDAIVKVRSIAQPDGSPLPSLTEEQQLQMMQSPEFAAAMNYYSSQDGQYGKMEIILKENPYAEKSLQVIPVIQSTIEQAVKGSALENAQLQLSGTTAQYYELEDLSQTDLFRTILFVIIGTLIVLMIMLRSIIAPIYILISLIINYFITMGILEWVFVDWLGNPGLSWTVSFFTFIIIVALGVDYSIFLMARIKEEYSSGNIQVAVHKAMVSTGGVIMSAALIMCGTFAAFMFSGVLTLMQIGAAIVIGLALYTIVFMGFIVPATVKLFGDKNGWPFKF